MLPSTLCNYFDINKCLYKWDNGIGVQDSADWNMAGSTPVFSF